MNKLLAILFVIGAFVALDKGAQALEPRVHIWTESVDIPYHSTHKPEAHNLQNYFLQGR